MLGKAEEVMKFEMSVGHQNTAFLSPWNKIEWSTGSMVVKWVKGEKIKGP